MKNLVIPGPITLIGDDDKPLQRRKKDAKQPIMAMLQQGAQLITEDED